MDIRGNLAKMQTSHQVPVQYHLRLDEQVDMNSLIGTSVRLSHTGRIFCMKCGNQTKTSFAQGYCYTCFTHAPETEECVLRPELCRAHEGLARDMEYARLHCLIDHVVYLALSPALKVGVTRHTQVPFRWIDQGAVMAIKVAVTPNRHTAGEMEVALKGLFSDKTNWRKMLSASEPVDTGLAEQKWIAEEALPFELRRFVIPSDEITRIDYPVRFYPPKINSTGFEKQMDISGTLCGIKGQYLIFDDGRVLNIRKYGGYEITLSF